MFSSQTTGVSDGGDEIDGVVGHVDDVLVGADAVERRHLVVRQLAWPSPAGPMPGMREPDDAPCAFAPLEDRQVPARPILDLRRAPG